MYGGTMGIVYGAACLWQWKITPDEPGWDAWTDALMSWKEAMNQEGSNFAGLVSKAFEGFDFTDMERRRDLTDSDRYILAKEGLFYIAYLDKGGPIMIRNMTPGLPYSWFNPKTGQWLANSQSLTIAKTSRQRFSSPGFDLESGSDERSSSFWKTRRPLPWCWSNSGIL